MLSVIVITENEERNIERCLDSVRWASEIIVVDAFSRDRTVEICTRFGAKVIQHAWCGYAAQKQFALDHAANEWVLSLDADEEITVELRDFIEKILSASGAYDGYEINRQSFFLGSRARYGGWFPDYQLRLFRREKTKIIRRSVHEGFSVEGRVGRAEGVVNHYTYHSIQHYLHKMNEYTSLEVLNKLLRKKRRVLWLDFITHPFSVFVRMFILLRGYHDGFRGFLLAFYSSLYNLLIYAKCWEYQSAQSRGVALPPVTNEELHVLQGLR
ncbi:MAG: glycosyltransferase family 2 protein [Bacteroidota bacterium]|nr:glycosyltransferase family 2 protein [Bacteroidota bacterium]